MRRWQALTSAQGEATSHQRMGKARPWPVILREDRVDGPPHGSLVLRPLRRSDAEAWTQLRATNAAWLKRWEASDPAWDADSAAQPITPKASFGSYVRGLTQAGRAGTAVPLGIEFDGELVGQIILSSITYGSLRGGSIGYWVSEHVAGRGIVPSSVALLIDHAFDTLALHRVEICIRPENAASLRVVAKLGLPEEGLRRRFLHIDGSWRDHRVFVAFLEDAAGPDGMMTRWQQITSM